MLKNAGLPTLLFFLANLLILGGLSVARAPLSIGQMLVVLSAIWFCFQSKKFPHFWADKYALGLMLMFILPFASYFVTEDTETWAKDLRIKLPFLFLPLAYSLAPSLSHLQYRLLALLFVFVHGLIGIVSVVVYYLKPHAQDFILHNGSISMISHIDHIYFGIFLSFSAIWAFWFFVEKYFEPLKPEDDEEIPYIGLKGNTFRYLMLFFAILNAIIIHFLTSRNGFLALYSGIFAFILYYLVKKRKYLLGATAFLGTALMPFLAYHFVPSFHNRIDISRWDLEQYFVHHTACDCSLTLRLIAWEKTVDIFKKSPIIGTGMADVRKDLLASYSPEKLNMNIAPDLLPNEFLDSPHSQYLEHLAGLGGLGILSLCFALFYPLFMERNSISFPQVAIIAIISAALLTESALERQWGIAFFITFAMLLRKKRSNSFNTIHHE
ncbi:MAG: O-antigen ligase family protein [Bacteroidia bacterium]